MADQEMLVVLGDERLPKRFWDKVQISEGGCWEWRGARTSKVSSRSYGQFYWEKRNQCAHRVAYQELIGAVSDNLHCDHLCRNPCCVNPSHIEPVTPAVNTRRGISTAMNKAKGAAVTHCLRGHEYTPENTRVHNGTRLCRACHAARCKAYHDSRRARAALAEAGGRHG